MRRRSRRNPQIACQLQRTLAGSAPAYTPNVKRPSGREGVSRPELKASPDAGDVAVMLHPCGASPVAGPIATESDPRTFCAERITEGRKEFFEALARRDGHLDVHLQISAQACPILPRTNSHRAPANARTLRSVANAWDIVSAIGVCYS